MQIEKSRGTAFSFLDRLEFSYRNLFIPGRWPVSGGKIMIQTTLKIDGMMCGMCESHINDAVRKDFPVKKVTTSHSKGTCVILSEEPLDEAKLRDTIDATGYTLLDIQSQPYEKKGGLAGLFHRK